MYSPIVYHNKYNISLYGLERLHPFDGNKFSKVLSYLHQDNLVKNEQHYTPEKASNDNLLLIHTQEYIDSLNYSSNIANVLEVYICRFIPSCILNKVVKDSFLYASGGSLLAAELAARVFKSHPLYIPKKIDIRKIHVYDPKTDDLILTSTKAPEPIDVFDYNCQSGKFEDKFQGGFAINLGGGYHHASYNKGEGFCMFSDISMCIKHVNKLYNFVKKFLVIDLDAHQGNGHERDKIDIFSNTNIDIFTIDAYNHALYPCDEYAEQGIDVNIKVTPRTNDRVYLSKVSKALEKAKAFAPQFIIYNAGTDILKGDPLGDLSISEQGIIDRDQMIFEFAYKNKIPIVYLFSGGYQEVTSNVIYKSLKNVEQHYKIFSDPNSWSKHFDY